MRLRDTGLVFAAACCARSPPRPNCRRCRPDGPRTSSSAWPTRPAAPRRVRAPRRSCFRYQYLAGGVNTGNGWATWNTNGDFATYYIQESIAQRHDAGVHLLPDAASRRPGGGSESDGDFTNLNNTATMTVVLQRPEALLPEGRRLPDNAVVLHVEPDMWGYMQQRASNDNAATVPAKVAATGIAELQGLPNTVAGFAQAIVQLRDTLRAERDAGVPRQRLGHGRRHRDLEPVRRAASTRSRARAAAFYTSLERQLRHRLRRVQRPRRRLQAVHLRRWRRVWWDADDFRRTRPLLAGFSRRGKRIVIWQIPFGNTQMRAENNTWNHYQDNRVEWLLDEPARDAPDRVPRRRRRRVPVRRRRRRRHLRLRRRGRRRHQPGADRRQHDRLGSGGAGTTPALVSRSGVPTLVTPYAADDDGGFFRWKAWAYYQAGALSTGSPPKAPVTSPPIIRFVGSHSPPPGFREQRRIDLDVVLDLGDVDGDGLDGGRIVDAERHLHAVHVAVIRELRRLLRSCRRPAGPASARSASAARSACRRRCVRTALPWA